MAIMQDFSPFTPYFLPQGHLLEVGRVASREATPLYGEIELKVLIQSGFVCTYGVCGKGTLTYVGLIKPKC